LWVATVSLVGDCRQILLRWFPFIGGCWQVRCRFFFFGVSSAICGGQEHFRLILCCVFGVSPVICGGQENFRRSGEVILWFWFGAVSVEESFW
jgi:hypothetical protein